LFDKNSTDSNIPFRSIKRLVPSTIFVADVFANDFPVVGIKDILAEYTVGVIKSIQDKPVILAFCFARNITLGDLTCVLCLESLERKYVRNCYHTGLEFSPLYA
jgi:hypothetical protein